jgi:hypothetical protein
VRIVYAFHDERFPVYLLTLFAKNEKDNLSKAERNALRKAVEHLFAKRGRTRAGKGGPVANG